MLEILADVIFETVGGDLFEAATQCIAFEGRILPIGAVQWQNTGSQYPRATGEKLLDCGYRFCSIYAPGY